MDEINLTIISTETHSRDGEWKGFHRTCGDSQFVKARLKWICDILIFIGQVLMFK
jgi:hypothetical protein